MEDAPTNHENLEQVSHAWLFDVDGVLTDPTEKQITNPEILDELIKRLEAGDVIGLNTGRSIDFVVEKVLEPLETKITQRGLLDKIVAIGEKSGVQITYKNGVRHEHTDESITVSSEIHNDVRTLVEAEFSDQMFFDETKKTMVSVEMKDGGDLSLFTEEQKILHQKLVEILERYKRTDLKIDPTTIATDIENKSVGKERGAIRFLQIIKERNISPANFIAFGDSKSDFEMIEPLEATGKPFTFVFVGEGNSDSSQNIRRTNAHYSEGTLEYLKDN